MNEKIYVNGFLDNSQIQSNSMINVSSTNITIGGNNQGTTSLMNGQIDDVFIFDFAMNEEQVSVFVSNKLEGDYKSTALAVIPVKESYPDFVGVPYKEINGQSILEIAIKNASQSKKITSVIVSSESQKVLDFSKKLEKDGKVPAHIRLLRDKDAK